MFFVNIFSFLNFKNQITQRAPGKMYKSYRKPTSSKEVMTVVFSSGIELRNSKALLKKL